MKLKVDSTTRSPLQHRLEIEVAWEELEKRIPQAVAWFKQNASIKGFRKGKAPDNVVRAHIGEKRILERAAEMLAGEAFEQAAKDLEKKPIAPPKIELGEIKPGEPAKFTATYYVEPPDPETLAKEIREKHYPGMPSPEDVFPDGPPGIQTHGPFGVSPEALKKIPGLSLGDKFIPDPLLKAPDPQSAIPTTPSKPPDLPDPEQLVKPPDVHPKVPELTEEMKKELESRKPEAADEEQEATAEAEKPQEPEKSQE